MKKSPKTKKNAEAAEKRLEALRRRIDVLDGRLVALLNQRSRLAQAIGRLKKANGGALYVPEREQQVLARLRKRNRGPLSQHSLDAIYREIMSAALSLEGDLKIGVADLPNGAVMAAARNRFGASATYECAESPAQAVRDLEAGRWHVLCIAESELPAACAPLQAGRLLVCGKAERGCAVLVRSAE